MECIKPIPHSRIPSTENDIAKGSAAEFITQVYIGMDINYIEEVDGKEWVDTGEKILGMLTKLQDNLRSRLHNT